MRKAVLLIDDSPESDMAQDLLDTSNMQYVKYHIKKFEESCCGELPTTKAPSIFAPQGTYKGLEGVKTYIELMKIHKDENYESESAFW